MCALRCETSCEQMMKRGDQKVFPVTEPSDISQQTKNTKIDEQDWPEHVTYDHRPCGRRIHGNSVLDLFLCRAWCVFVVTSDRTAPA